MANALGDLSKVKPEHEKQPADAIKEQCLSARQAMVQNIVKSFVQVEGPVRIRSPLLKTDRDENTLKTFEPYHRFYLSHQRDFDMRIPHLQSQIRDGISAYSKPLAELAAMDEFKVKVLRN